MDFPTGLSDFARMHWEGAAIMGVAFPRPPAVWWLSVVTMPGARSCRPAERRQPGMAQELKRRESPMGESSARSAADHRLVCREVQRRPAGGIASASPGPGRSEPGYC